MTNFDPERQERWARHERQILENRLHETESAMGIEPTDVSAWPSQTIENRLKRLSVIGLSRIPESDFYPNLTPVRLGDLGNH